MRKWLNGEFFNEAFSEEEKALLAKTKQINNNNEVYLGLSSLGGSNTEDLVFLPSILDYVQLPDFSIHTTYLGGKYASNVAKEILGETNRGYFTRSNLKGGLHIENGSGPCDDPSQIYGVVPAIVIQIPNA